VHHLGSLSLSDQRPKIVHRVDNFTFVLIGSHPSRKSLAVRGVSTSIMLDRLFISGR
jgi:hypothetical protein